MKENGDIKAHETLRQAGRVPSPEIGPKIILPGLTVTSHGAAERGDVFLHRAGRQKSGESNHLQTANAISHYQAALASRGGEKITTFEPEPTASLPTDAGDKDSNRAAGGAGLG